MEIIFMDEALRDIDAIYDFLVEAKVVQADEIIGRVIASADQLRDFPKLGVRVHRSSQWGYVRDLYSGNYCLRYALLYREAVCTNSMASTRKRKESLRQQKMPLVFWGICDLQPSLVALSTDVISA
jgi:plasmid stabilization system protein ParE